MILVHINIQKGLNTKAPSIEKFCVDHNVEILAVTECDAHKDRIPDLEGFTLITQHGSHFQRLIVYAKIVINIEQINIVTDTPSIFLRLGSGIILFTYSEFTNNSIRLPRQLKLRGFSIPSKLLTNSAGTSSSWVI
jgi:hypothetical protein